ncbi:unnamed protein product [Ectocarpus sp. 13 AM-2016]
MAGETIFHEHAQTPPRLVHEGEHRQKRYVLTTRKQNNPPQKASKYAPLHVHTWAEQPTANRERARKPPLNRSPHPSACYPLLLLAYLRILGSALDPNLAGDLFS